MLFLVAFSLVHVVPEARADGVPPGWLSGYTYRQKHEMTGAANAGIGYQVKFRVYRGSGTSSGANVYLNGKCKADFSDVRFADADGHVFSYWIQTVTTDYADIWVKVGVDLGVNNTFYVYYGNPDAYSESNFDATFIFGETWSSTTLNTSKWTVEAGTISINTDEHYIQISSNTRVRSTSTSIIFPAYFRVERAWTDEPVRFNGWRTGSGETGSAFSITDRAWAYSDGSRGIIWFGVEIYYYSYAPVGYYARRCAGIGHNKDYTYTSGLTDSHDWSLYLSRQGTTYFLEGIRNETYISSEPNRVYLAAGATVAARIWDFKIRKYVQPEPQHGSWYPEESITVTQARLNVNVEPSWLSYIAFTLDYPTQVLFAPWTNIIGTGSHTVTVLDEKVRVNGSYVFGFKCWKKAGEIVSFDKSYTFTLSPGTTDITIVYVAHNVSIVSDPEMYVRVKIDDFQVQTPTTVYRGSGYYNFEALDTQLYYNATHMLKFYGWYVDNVYIGSDPNVNIYISYKTTIKLAYKAVEVPAPPPMTFKASVVDLGQIQAGTSKDFSITVTFDATALTIQSVEFQAKSDWLQVVDTLPMYATKGLETVGTATIMCRLTVPQNVQGYYSIPYKVTAKTSQDITITTSSYITFTATPQPVTVEAVSAQPGAIAPAGFAETVQRILGNPIILILLIALTIWLAAYTIKKRS